MKGYITYETLSETLQKGIDAGGSGGSYVEIVNDLESGGAKKALSEEQKLEDTNTNVSNLDANLKNAQNDLRAIEKKADDNTSAIGAVELEITSVKERATTLETKTKNLETKTTATDTKLGTVETKVNGHDKSIADNIVEITDIKEDIINVKKDVNTNKDNIQANKTDIDTLKQDIAKVKVPDIIDNLTSDRSMLLYLLNKVKY